ncbi:MAG: cation transporter [Chloroflexi bacterium]|nr:cation transporter [Chloroflexota bacterium]
MRSISTGIGAVKLSMVVVISLILLKLVVSVLSNSISIAAQATDSVLDIVSIAITYVALKMSITPADEKHPFGHGKAEGLAAMIQAILVLGAGGFIIYSAIQRIVRGTAIQPDEGMAVMGVSIVASYLLSRHLRLVAKATGSTAIDASARNIGADVYSAVGVLLGLLLVRLTKLVILDPIVALIMAGFVLKAGYEVTVRAFHEIVDYSLPRGEQEVLDSCLRAHEDQLVGYHSMRSRRAGSERFIDLHLVMPRDYSVEKAHAVCDHLEQDIRQKIANANVTIHAEPCNSEDCVRCSIVSCDLRASGGG